jgi:starch-binding outer membrane protein, SusD/RagB family
MKKRISKICFLLILLTGINISCDKDFLEVSPKGVINSDSFYATREDAEQAVTTVYGMLNYMQVWDMWILADLGSVASDDAEAGGATNQDVPDWQNYDNFTFTPAQPGGFAQPYGILYKMIFHANIALENLPGIPAKDSTASESFINERLAEVKFLRAFAFYYLVQIFGEVPLADHVLLPDEYFMGRSSMRSVFDLMEKDLQEAIAVLPVIWPGVGLSATNFVGEAGTDIGRVTKGAAQGLLAKVLVLESSYARNYPGDNYSLVFPGESRFKDLEEKWDEALAMAENVINSGQYILIGSDGAKDYSSWRGLTDGYRYVWTTNGDNSRESVFEIQAGYYGLNWLNTRGSSMAWWTGVRWIYEPDGVTPMEAGYWGFNIPSRSLVKEFYQEQRLPEDPLYGVPGPPDPRFNTTIHKDTIGGNDSIQFSHADAGGLYWAKCCYEYDATWNNKPRSFQAKYECSYDEFRGLGANWSESPFNNRMIRYADIVLIAAEAAIMNGDNEKARTYINMVRTRARMCGHEGNTVPADYASGTTITMDMLIHERRLELAMEGHRFFDLVRWNLATEYLDGHYLSNLDQTIDFISPKFDFYPIPDAEVNTSQGNLLQYHGW